jgi:hypothetical protein
MTACFMNTEGWIVFSVILMLTQLREAGYNKVGNEAGNILMMAFNIKIHQPIPLNIIP